MAANGVALGLVAALCWGVADFCARRATRAAGTFRTLLVVQVLGIAGLLAFGLPLDQFRFDAASPDLIVAAAGISLVILAGAGLLYRALAIGTLALVSPIAASFAAVTAVLALATGERLSPAQLGGVALTLVGVAIASTVPSATKEVRDDMAALAQRHWSLAPGLLEALGSTLVFGVGYWLLGFVTPALGGVTVALIAKLADFVVLGALAVALLLYRLLTHAARTASGRASYRRLPAGSRTTPKENDPPSSSLPPSFWLFVVPVGLLDTAANVAYNIGITVALTSVVVVIASLFSAVTVLLAWIVLRERLAAWQWAGVAAILVGILLVNV